MEESITNATLHGHSFTACIFLHTSCVIQVSSHIIYYSKEFYNAVVLPVLQIKKPNSETKNIQGTQYESGRLLVLSCNF